MARYVETSNLPNFEVVCSDGKKYVLLPFEHLSDIPTADVAPKSEVARAFRQRMNEKMGKHTHLLGKEYVQRIMREIEKEFTEEKE